MKWDMVKMTVIWCTLDNSMKAAPHIYTSFVRLLPFRIIRSRGFKGIPSAHFICLFQRHSWTYKNTNMTTFQPLRVGNRSRSRSSDYARTCCSLKYKNGSARASNDIQLRKLKLYGKNDNKAITALIFLQVGLNSSYNFRYVQKTSISKFSSDKLHLLKHQASCTKQPLTNY